MKVRDRWMGRIMGPGHARTLILLEQAAISTMVLTKGYMATGGELRGKNGLV
jgi:hypothetical protein